eukprot:TRINITY_DN1430_c0_g1_i1.p1 TRINITY_DN1430_c0_g1~~TRINITY_DN1430_c0_g1_i1.p1  ORF type:complete len:331 (-),score=86.74 TRINITY_DN1430_c0_g1_i1:189-1181(-)
MCIRDRLNTVLKLGGVDEPSVVDHVTIGPHVITFRPQAEFPDGCVTATMDMTVRQGLHAMNAARIRFLPIVDQAGAVMEGVDVGDVAAYLVRGLGDAKEDAVVDEANALLDMPILEAASCSCRNQFNTIEIREGTTLREAAGLLMRDSKRIVAVEPSTGKPCGVISRGQVMKLFAERLKDSSKQSVGLDAIEMGNRDVCCVDEGASVLEAMKTMVGHNISSVVALSNESHRFITMFSSSDIRMLAGPLGAKTLLQTVHQAQVMLHQAMPQAMVSCVTCKTTDSVVDVAGRLAATKVHRLVVLDPETNKIVSLISLLDILQLLYRDIEPSE